MKTATHMGTVSRLLDHKDGPAEAGPQGEYKPPMLTQLGDLRGETLGTSGGYGESGGLVDSHYQ